MHNTPMAHLGYTLTLSVALAVGGLVASAQALLATEYQLQVASVEEKLFHSYVDTQGAPFRTYLHILPRLEEALDRGTLPSSVLLPDCAPRLMQTGANVPGQMAPRVVDLTATKHALSDIYIATALERGKLPVWVAKHAVSQNGLAVVVGRNHDLKFPAGRF